MPSRLVLSIIFFGFCRRTHVAVQMRSLPPKLSANTWKFLKLSATPQVICHPVTTLSVSFWSFSTCSSPRCASHTSSFEHLKPFFMSQNGMSKPIPLSSYSLLPPADSLWDQLHNVQAENWMSKRIKRWTATSRRWHHAASLQKFQSQVHLPCHHYCHKRKS